MALNPVPALTFSVLWGVFVASITNATATTVVLPSCKGWDVITGCDSTVSVFVSTMALGTIPGAPAWLNVFFGVVGVTARSTAIWAILELFRGS